MIIEPWNNGLGDQWATINLSIQMAYERGKPVLLHSPPRLRKLHEEILAVLDYTEFLGVCPVELTINPPTLRLDGYNLWATEYQPTLPRWHRSAIKPVMCVQFDGQSNAADKNPPQEEQAEILHWGLDNGLTCVGLGKHMSIAECVNDLSTCTLFVGSCSGMSHVAHSVGCPTYILEYGQPVVTCHRNKNYVLCKGAGHFIQQANNWMNYLRFLTG